MWGRTHTSFVREQTTCNTITDSQLYRSTYCTTEERFWSKCINEDGCNSTWQVADVNEDTYQTTNQIESSHDRNDLLGNGSDGAYAAQEDEECQSSNDHADDQWVDAECGVECITDGVGLYHVTDEAQSQNDEDGEQSSQYFTESTFVSCADVVNRTTGYSAVVANGFVLLSQGSFYEVGSHAEECGNPHPEDRAHTTGSDSGSSTSKVTGTYLSSDGSCQCLEGRHTVFTSFVTGQFDVAEYLFETFSKVTNLYAFGFDGEPYTCADKSKQQEEVPQEAVDGANNVF